MRHLIRSGADHAFLTEDGKWTDDVHRAAPFADARAALSAVQAFRLDDVEIYHAFDERRISGWDFAVPVSRFGTSHSTPGLAPTRNSPNRSR